MKIMRTLLLVCGVVCLFLPAANAATDQGLYVVNSSGNTVSVIDPSSDTVTATISVGGDPELVAALPDASAVYVTNSLDNSLSVIDPDSNTVTGTVELGAIPRGVAAGPGSDFVYVTLSTNQVAVVDTSTNTVTDTIDVDDTPRGLVVNPAGTFLYVTNSVGQSVSVIDLSDNTVVATVPFEEFDYPQNITVSDDGSEVYAATFVGGQVKTIDTGGNIFGNITTVESSPRGLAITPDGTKLYVVNNGSNDVSVLGLSDLTVSDTIAVGFAPNYGVFNADGSKFYVTESSEGSVGVVDTETLTRTSEIAVGFSPVGIAMVRTQPGISLSVAAVDFESVASGVTSSSQTVTVASTGTEDLSISNIAVTGDFAETNDCGDTLAPDETCTITLTFTPTATGSRTGTLTVTSDASTSPTTATLTGTGLATAGSSNLTVTVDSDGTYFNTFAQKGVLSGSYFNFYITATNSGSASFGASNVTFGVYILRGSTVTLASSLIEYNTSGQTIGTYPCTTTVVSTTAPTISCPVGTVSAASTRHFKLLARMDLFFYNVSTSYGNVGHPVEVGDEPTTETVTVTSGSLSTTETYGMHPVGWVRSAVGCSLNSDPNLIPSSNGGLLLIVLFTALTIVATRLRVSRSHFLSAIILMVLLVGSSAAQASTAVFAPNSDVPVLGSSGLIYTLGGEVSSQRFTIGFDTRYAYKLMESGISNRPILKHQLIHDLALSFAPCDRWQFDISLPVFSLNRLITGAGYSNQAGLGDGLLRAHFVLWQNDKSHFAIIPSVTLPFGNENDFRGNKYPVGGLKVAVDRQFSERWFAAANLGFDAGQSVQFLNYSRKGRLLASGGVSYQATSQLKLKSDVVVKTAINKPFQERVTSSLEMLGGATYALKDRPVAFNASAGGSILRDGVSPSFQALLGVTIGFEKLRKVPSQDDLAAMQPTIYFDTASSEVGPANQALLDRAAKLLKKYRKLRVIVAEGHTDSRGSRRFNKILSLDRATSAKNYLVQKHIAADRIQVIGFAERKPAASNRTVKGRAQNRRVVLRVEM